MRGRFWFRRVLTLVFPVILGGLFSIALLSGLAYKPARAVAYAGNPGQFSSGIVFQPSGASRPVLAAFPGGWPGQFT